MNKTPYEKAEVTVMSMEILDKLSELAGGVFAACNHRNYLPYPCCPNRH